MNYDEFTRLAKGLKSAYTGVNFLPDADSLKIWYSLLKDIDYDLASAAVQRYICTERFPPTIADIRNQCAMITVVDHKDWLEGWRMIQTCIHRFGYTRPKESLAELRKTDEITASVAQMLGWQHLCESENAVADRAAFRQTYEVMQKRKAEELRLPQNVRGRISGITDNLSLAASEVEE